MAYPVERLPRMIYLGKQTENSVVDVAFDVSEWLRRWPEMIFAVMPTRPGETNAYPADTTLCGTTLTWHVRAYDTQKRGLGTVELLGLCAGGERKLSSATAQTSVTDTTLPKGNEPDQAPPPWLDGVLLAGEAAKAAAVEAERHARRVEELAMTNGYLFMELGEDGCLYAVKSGGDADEVSFALNEFGELEVYAHG